MYKGDRFGEKKSDLKRQVVSHQGFRSTGIQRKRDICCCDYLFPTGTTLNLVKFPIVNPAPWRLALRSKRLKKDEKKFATEELVRKLRLSELGSFKAAVLTG